MKERERILELVKNNIITSEEALVLLENLATEKDEALVKEAADQVEAEKSNEISEKEPETTEEIIEDWLISDEDNEKAEKERLEKVLDELATQANRASAELDGINESIVDLERKAKELDEQISVLDTMEELGALSAEKTEELQNLRTEKQNINDNLIGIKEQKRVLGEKLKAIRKEQREESGESWSKKFDIPEDWKQTANETFDQMGEKMSEAGSQLGKFLKDTFSSVVTAVNENVDWKEVNMKVPGLASTKFEHTFYYPNNLATLINVKLANGDIVFKSWDSMDVKVEAKIKLYGKMEEDSFEAFLKRSEIEVDDESISFQIPNKRVRADLVFYLPRRTYDHVSVKILNGDFDTQDFETKDIYLKSTNGDMTFEKLTATMLEVEGVNGDIKVVDSLIRDFVGESINGDIVVKGAVENFGASIINGDIKFTVLSETISKVTASSINGDVKIALPKSVSLDAYAQTHVGSLRSRLSDVEVIREKKEKANKLLELRRKTNQDIVFVKLNTTTGDIYLKDVD